MPPLLQVVTFLKIEKELKERWIKFKAHKILKTWVNGNHGDLRFEVVQFLSEHGCYQFHLHRKIRSPDYRCKLRIGCYSKTPGHRVLEYCDPVAFSESSECQRMYNEDHRTVQDEGIQTD